MTPTLLLNRTVLWAALCSGLAFAQTVQAAPQSALRADELHLLAPGQVRALLMKQVRQQKRSTLQAAGAADTLDTTPPVLTKFSAARSVDVSRPAAAALATISATDDLSGISGFLAMAIGPSGQTVLLTAYPRAATKYSGTVGQGYTLTGFEEPGSYTFTYANLHDVAGNSTYISQAQLVALGGRTGFTLMNRNGFDRTAPQLVKGKIVTSVASLSATHPGTTQPMQLRVNLDLTDAGDSALSGLDTANAEFCLADESQCFHVFSHREPPRRAAATVTLARHLELGYHQPGEYHLRSLGARDYAGNWLYLVGTAFGGTTDFSTTFASTTITIRP